MTLRRLPPLAIALALVAVALVATVLAARHSVNAAFTTVGDGQAIAEEQAVRADLSNLDGPPTSSDLETFVAQHRDEGLRYVALIDIRATVVAEAGTPRGTFSPRSRANRVERPRAGREVVPVRDRLRVESPYGFRRSWGRDSRGIWLAIEIEPSQAAELRAASDRSIWIGVVAALALFGVAIAIVRRELRRQAEDRARERERRLASLGEMSAVLAHEIKNPLASLKGNAQLLAGSLPAGEKPRAKAERVVDEAVRLEKLIQDLLAFVRTGVIERSAYDPVILAHDAASAVQGEVVVEAGAVRNFQIDGPRIREVLVNLLDNAIAAGPPARIRVTVEGDRLIYEITDHGPGVPVGDRDKIFEPFHTGKTRGTGLGLAIAKRLVELHRGTITVDDAPGGGARFRIALPEA
jgi:two-component system sensor histidine kinase HydH